MPARQGNSPIRPSNLSFLSRKYIPLRAGIAYLTISLFCLSSAPANGQVLISLILGDNLNSGKVEFGLDGGLSYSWQEGVNTDKLYSNFNLGFYFDIKLKNPKWLVHTGVIVLSTQGATGAEVYPLGNADLDSTFSSGSLDRIMNYFNVPIMMKYKIAKNFYVEAGPMLSLLYKSNDEFRTTVNGEELTYRINTIDRFYRVDGGVMAGLGYRLLKGEGMNLGIRYYHGLRDIVKDNPGNAMMNRTFYIAIGIPIGAQKARERAEKKALEKQ